MCSFYHKSLRTWIKTNVNKFAISNHTALILGVHALRSYLKLIYEYEFHSLPNKKLVAQTIMVKTTARSDRPWSAIFGVIVYCEGWTVALPSFYPAHFCHYIDEVTTSTKSSPYLQTEKDLTENLIQLRNVGVIHQSELSVYNIVVF